MTVLCTFRRLLDPSPPFASSLTIALTIASFCLKHYGISKCTENGSYSTNTVCFGVMLCSTLIPTPSSEHVFYLLPRKRQKNIPIIRFYIYVMERKRGVTENATMHEGILTLHESSSPRWQG